MNKVVKDKKDREKKRLSYIRRVKIQRIKTSEAMQTLYIREKHIQCLGKPCRAIYKGKADTMPWETMQT